MICFCRKTIVVEKLHTREKLLRGNRVSGKNCISRKKLPLREKLHLRVKLQLCTGKLLLREKLPLLEKLHQRVKLSERKIASTRRRDSAGKSDSAGKICICEKTTWLTNCVFKKTVAAWETESTVNRPFYLPVNYLCKYWLCHWNYQYQKVPPAQLPLYRFPGSLTVVHRPGPMQYYRYMVNLNRGRGVVGHDLIDF